MADTTALSIEAGRALDGDAIAMNDLAGRAERALIHGKLKRWPLHWPLEFPEVFARDPRGFDAIVGNPPFLGNRLWKMSVGDHFQWQCQFILRTPPGKIDLSVVFHRRALDLLRTGGCYGLLGASNMAEGSAIEVGLGVVVQSGDIYLSRKRMPWPGTAAVVVAFVVFFKGRWQGQCVADGAACERIGARLEPEQRDAWKPKELQSPIFSFEGVNNSKGLAFVITADDPWFRTLKEESDSLLRPYITGDDITSYALRKTNRWALDVADRSLEEIERRWPEAFRFLIEVVLPTRTQDALKSYNGLQDRWWQFWNHRADLMRRLRRRERFIAFAKATKYPFCMLASSEWIYTNQVLLIGMEREDLFPICSSSFFRNWLHAFSVRSLGADKNTLRLSIRESVSTFVLPTEIVTDKGQRAASRFQEIVVAWSAEHEGGLTDALNAVNTRDCRDQAIDELRRSIETIDAEVASAYGWPDLDLLYRFEPFPDGSANDRWRWAPSGKTVAETTKRLTDLNKKRHDADFMVQNEVKGDGKPSRRGRKRTTDQKSATTTLSDADLLMDDALPNYDLFAHRGHET